MSQDPATARQAQASNPDQSTWLAANAGSGKTRVLTNRVARLLLSGTRPEHILCLTYTKAAAAEMQNRLFHTLGEWAMLPDSDLAQALGVLGEAELTSRQLCRARTLFACAIETPGGLQIQTIHAFCARLLRRFPLEAGVSPQFVEMDDQAMERLVHQIIHQMAEGKEAPLLDAFAAQLSGENSMDKIILQVVKNCDAFQQNLLTWPQLLEIFSLPTSITEKDLVEQVFQTGDMELLAELRGKLTGSDKVSDRNASKKMVSLAMVNPTVMDIALLEDVFLTGTGAKEPFTAKEKFPTQALCKTITSLVPALKELMKRVEKARPQRLGLAAAQRSMALHNFARAFLPIYANEKQQRGWLDFDDLIQKSRVLLRESSVADWVLFRLDRGVDHILVDEAQDTSPAQWDVIERLTQEFSSGEGARASNRTIFVVGDKKQSIYSFQGAEPTAFDKMADMFHGRLKGAKLHLQQLHLEYSFRSAPVILQLVDVLFADQKKAGFSSQEHHKAFKTTLPGRVDLWPLVAKKDKEELPQWSDSKEYTHPHIPAKILAEQVATFIQGLIHSRETIPITARDGTIQRRVIQPEDVLILVQRRSDLFTEIIAACKAKALPIAGADRLKVAAELAVKDLVGLLRFLATPADDLSLAEALKSPIFSWNEQQLFALAHHRPSGCSLGQALKKQAIHYPKTITILEDLRSKTDYLRPYELLERILTRHGARQRLIGRLGPEAEDGIDALLSQALAYETTEVPSLTGFLLWATTDELEVKRQLSEVSDMVRVMTVHGAKGLEAPIVILPDTLFSKRDPGADQLIKIVDGNAWLWNTKTAERPDVLHKAVSAQQEKEQEENMRLLYVAMTRAQSWLIVAGAGDSKEEKDHWYNHVNTGVQRFIQSITDSETKGIAVHHLQGDGKCYPDGKVLRLSCGEWSVLPQQQDDQHPKEKLSSLPSYLLDLTHNQQPMAEPAVINPSKLDGDKALSGSEAGLKPELAKMRGTAIHQLLETLPCIPSEFWHDVATQLLHKYHEYQGFEQDKIIQEVVDVLSVPDFAEVFAEDALAEVGFSVTVAGHPMQGTMDRILVRPDKVLVIDFKSNVTVPKSPQNCPEGILRQMGAYRHALTILYPGLTAEAAILWTRTATMMHLPNGLLQDAWQDYQSA